MIGAGVVGLATARALARSGVDVALVEQHQVLPARGSSSGDARIRVLAAYPDDEYLALGLRAAEHWRELEFESGAKLLHETGALSYGEGIEDLIAALERFGVEHRELDQTTLARRFPQVSLAGCGPVVHQPDGAVIAADRVLESLLASALGAGVDVRDRERVISLRPAGSGVVVETAQGDLGGELALIVAGPWAASLVPWPDLAMQLRPSLQTISFFEWEGPPPPALLEYGHPDPYSAWSPAHGLKAADHEPGPDVEPGITSEPDPKRVSASAEWVARRFPSIAAQPVRTETCFYTNTPDERFILERRGPIGVVSACNGQGFQFAPIVGELAAEMMAA